LESREEGERKRRGSGNCSDRGEVEKRVGARGMRSSGAERELGFPRSEGQGRLKRGVG